MQLSELLESVRRAYVNQLEFTVRGLAAQDPKRRMLMEAAHRGPDGEPVLDGAFSLPMRADIVLVGSEGASPLLVASPSVPNFRPASLPAWEGFTMHLQPFAWDACRIDLRCEHLEGDALRVWFFNYFGGEDEYVEAALAKPRGLVHFMDDPKETRDGLTLEVDFGTAPVAAFLDLGGALKDGGALEATFRSKDRGQ